MSAHARIPASGSAGTPIDFAPMMGLVARRLLGEPNRALSSGRTLRWGTHGSLKVDLDPGAFHDKEANQGGGVLDLVMREQRCDKGGALAWMEREGFIETRPGQRQEPAARTFYDYADADGVIAYRVERRGKDHVPPFLQYGPDGRGGFHAGKGCMSRVARLPYRLPELLAADPAAPVFVVEGEKDADRLTALGLVATTNSEGAGKFRAELARHFAGRRVVIIPDNDKPGRDHAADVASKLAGVAAAIATLELPDLPEKGDVSGWIPLQDYGADAAPRLLALAEAALHQPTETFPIADLTAWARTEPAPKAFTMAGFIPAGEVTLFTGPGGSNKSTFGLQLCACAAASLPMLGVAVAAGPALYVTAEDEDRENHWRLRKIAGWIGTSLDRLAGKLHVVSLRGRLNNELATFDAEGRLHVAPAMRLLRATIEATGSRLIVLDNVAHLFAGNENDRAHVTAFVNLLYQLCRDLSVTVVLIGHPNKAGDSYSGSTAWLNAVRSQIVLERPEGSPDPDARLLTLGKANYARQGEELTFRWHDFALVQDMELAPNVREELAATAAASGDNAIFLACLEARARDGLIVSPNVSPNYAPAQFEAMPLAKGIGKVRLRAAMERLLSIGAIEVFDRENKDKGRSIKALRVGPRTSPHGFPDASRTVSGRIPGRTPDQAPHDPAHTPPLKGGEGAATRAAAPSPIEDRPRRHGGPILAPGE